MTDKPEYEECDDEEEWCETCQNLGTIECLCGGDLCVCTNRGDMPCPDCGGGP